MFGIKNNPRLTVHMIVANEDRWIWYAISSVIDFSEKIIIYDTGSHDKTIEIIKSFKSTKIEFSQKGTVDSDKLTKLRQEQVEKTKTPWFMILDGDEVWPEQSLIEVLQLIKKKGGKKVGVVVKTGICLGDIYHFQNENAGRYVLGHKRGHYNIRFYKKVNGYHWIKPYPDEAYVDKYGIPIQNQEDKLIFTEFLYWHMRHLPRSSVLKSRKYKLELGYKVDSKNIPQVFLKSRPTFVSSPWVKYSPAEYLIASFLTPLRIMKRKISD